VSTIVCGSNYAEYDELPVPVQRKLNEFLSPVQRKLDEDCVPVQHEEESQCKSEPDSTSARLPKNPPSSSSASSMIKRSQTSSRQEPSSSFVPVSKDRTSCCHERRKLPDPGGRQSCCHEQRKLPDGQSCCHGQRKLPDPGDRQSCCHEQRKLPVRQSCCHGQRKLPDPEVIPLVRPSADRVSVSNSKAGEPCLSSSYDVVRFEQRPKQPVCLLSPRAFTQWLEENRTRSARSEDSTQPVESPSTGRSPKTRRSRSSMRYQLHQPTMIQPNLDLSNSRLPIRLASPKKSCHRWTQQRKVPPDPTPPVPVNAQPDRPVEVKFHIGNVTDELPANAVGLQAECIPVHSTGSNPEDHGEFLSVSPVVPVSDVRLMRPKADGISASISQAGEPIPRIVRADTRMSASNHDRRPDDDSSVYHSVDEEIYSTV